MWPRFVPDDLLHELRWSLFGGFLHLPPCEHCRGSGRLTCDAPLSLARDGTIHGRVDHEEAIVSWPGCPRQWAGARQWGQDVLGLADICQWEVDRGTHQRADIPSSTARILREYLVLREWPDKIAEAIQVRKMKEGRK